MEPATCTAHTAPALNAILGSTSYQDISVLFQYKTTGCCQQEVQDPWAGIPQEPGSLTSHRLCPLPQAPASLLKSTLPRDCYFLRLLSLSFIANKSSWSTQMWKQKDTNTSDIWMNFLEVSFLSHYPTYQRQRGRFHDVSVVWHFFNIYFSRQKTHRAHPTSNSSSFQIWEAVRDVAPGLFGKGVPRSHQSKTFHVFFAEPVYLWQVRKDEGEGRAELCEPCSTHQHRFAVSWALPGLN